MPPDQETPPARQLLRGGDKLMGHLRKEKP